MITRQDLQDLLSRRLIGETSVLSVYLNVDQRSAANLNRGFEAALKSQFQLIERELVSEEERRKFLENARQAAVFLSDYQPEGKSVVLFLDSENSFSWSRSLSLPIQNEVHWMSRPYVRPLLEARDEFQRYGVVLTDRARARLFSIFLGSIEEHREALAEAEVKKFDASGHDQMRSQMHFQRRAQEHAKWHLKCVSELAEDLAGRRRFDRVVLAGPHEVTKELMGLLSDRLKKACVGMISLPIDAAENEILAATLRLEEEAERQSECELVETLLTAAAKNQQAVLGLEGTVRSLNEGRIRRVVYSATLKVDGSICGKCNSLFQKDGTRCPLCWAEMRVLPDLVEAVLARSFCEGAEVEQVKGGAAEQLQKGGGIGAFLRF